MDLRKIFVFLSFPFMPIIVKAQEKQLMASLMIGEKIEIMDADMRDDAFISPFYNNWTNKGVRNASGYVPRGTDIALNGFTMPTDSRKVTSPFGQRWGRLHAGIDVKVYIGDTIRAAFDGKVRISSYDRNGYGKYVLIRHMNGFETLYGHMSKLLVRNNEYVRSGQPIGLGGNTGRSTGSHLHFEVRLCGSPLNPSEVFDFVHQDVTGDVYRTRQSFGRK